MQGLTFLFIHFIFEIFLDCCQKTTPQVATITKHKAMFYNSTIHPGQFKIDYPYYGLFGSADITELNENGETIYKCKLLNGSIILLKKLLSPKKWIDANLNRETALSSIIGMSIDDFLKSR